MLFPHWQVIFSFETFIEYSKNTLDLKQIQISTMWNTGHDYLENLKSIGHNCLNTLSNYISVNVELCPSQQIQVMLRQWLLFSSDIFIKTFCLYFPGFWTKKFQIEGVCCYFGCYIFWFQFQSWLAAIFGRLEDKLMTTQNISIEIAYTFLLGFS